MKAVIPSLYPHPKTSQFPPSSLPKRASPRPRIFVKSSTPATQDDGIPTDLVKTLVKIKSRHNDIRVLEVSRTADHPFRGSRLLLLDSPGNIHSISFLYKTLTETYFDVFATLPPILPPGPVGVLGFGAGSAAKLLLELFPDSIVHGWEIDPAVVDVAREYFGVAKLQEQFPDRLFVYIGNALNASLATGFSGILVDLFSKGSLLPELQDPATWAALNGRLRDGGRIMVNVGGSCVESEDSGRDGKAVMEETLMAMKEVFGEDELNVLSLGNRKDDSSIALTGALPADLKAWKEKLPKCLNSYVDMWTPFSGCARQRISDARFMKMIFMRSMLEECCFLEAFCVIDIVYHTVAYLVAADWSYSDKGAVLLRSLIFYSQFGCGAILVLPVGLVGDVILLSYFTLLFKNVCGESCIFIPEAQFVYMRVPRPRHYIS